MKFDDFSPYNRLWAESISSLVCKTGSQFHSFKYMEPKLVMLLSL